MDIAGGLPDKDTGAMTQISDASVTGTDGPTGEEAPPPQRAPESIVSRPQSNLPILLDDAGAVIHCFYHPGADAVNLCSRCKQYVCIECNYVTGTHPICRNCWEKRAEVPLAPTVQKVAPPPSKAEKKKEAKVPEPRKHTEVTPPVAEEPIVAEQPETAETVAPEPPIAQQPQAAAPGQPEAPVISEQPVQVVEIKEVGEARTEKPQVVPPIKSAKLEAESKQWQQEFMAVYKQAAPIINMIIRKDSGGMPASPLDLMEGLKLRPILELVKKLSKPKDKDLREAKSDLEHLLTSCIKIADAAADFIRGGGQALLGGPDFKRIVDGIETATALMDKFSQKLPAFSRPSE
jgi:hypothetical protein